MVGTVRTDRCGEKLCQAQALMGRELAITKRRPVEHHELPSLAEGVEQLGTGADFDVRY